MVDYHKEKLRRKIEESIKKNKEFNPKHDKIVANIFGWLFIFVLFGGLGYIGFMISSSGSTEDAIQIWGSYIFLVLSFTFYILMINRK